MTYSRRLVDNQLDTLLPLLPAIAVEGAKGVGKTETATGRATQTYALDDPTTFAMVEATPELVLRESPTTFIDEWQRVPSTWDLVRRAVDRGAPPGRFLLAGSASPAPQARPHSGAGRIVRLMMRPMSLPERGVAVPTVSLATLLEGGAPDVGGRTTVTLDTYTAEILSSGFPGIRFALPNARPFLLDSYLDRLVDHDIPEAGHQVRRPGALTQWLTAMGAATATTASYASLLTAATPGDDPKPSKVTAMAYRDLLASIWVLEPLPAWSPHLGGLKYLGQSPKHHLVDPALAARLVGATAQSLVRGDGPRRGGEDVFLGALFESLAVQTLRCLAQTAGAKVSHLRTQGGDHEVDIIVQRPDLKILAFEVKLGSTVRPSDVTQLTWLRDQLPDLVVDTVLLNTGPEAYRRRDGVAVVPLALLGV
ncbi:MAG: DUF4143 domain-containing protein [Propionibacteriaceae bacterium]|jgi:predicted AAA+ superfamily ATPase|nr:DUF4143 domain-containing protein [Propionibacteriaceae bacterium]